MSCPNSMMCTLSRPLRMRHVVLRMAAWHSRGRGAFLKNQDARRVRVLHPTQYPHLRVRTTLYCAVPYCTVTVMVPFRRVQGAFPRPYHRRGVRSRQWGHELAGAGLP